MIKNIYIKKFKGIEEIGLENLGRFNAFVGKNNSGKSTILHAIDMAGLALSLGGWDQFQPKLEIKDMFSETKDFEIKVVYEDGHEIEIRSSAAFGPEITPNREKAFKSLLIVPDPGYGLLRRRHKTPKSIIDQIEGRQFHELNSLEILFAIKFYGERNERNLTTSDYEALLMQIKDFFPELEKIESDRTELDVPTLTYQEFGKTLDIIYSGTGLKHFIDVLVKSTLSRADVLLIDEPEMGLHPDLQKRFIEYLNKLSQEKNIQIFVSTHSPVFLNYLENVNFFRMFNVKGKRSIQQIPIDSSHTLICDLGIKPSDVFNQDICLMVEGSTDVIFFEHIIKIFYKEEFDKISIGVLQYGGSAAEGIISGAIDVSNLTPAQKYTFWIRDRDAEPTSDPSINSTQFKNALFKAGLECHVLNKQEIEWYFPEVVHKSAQQGDTTKEKQAIEILNGNQSEKFTNAASQFAICVPTGKNLRKLLVDYVTSKDQIDQEILDLIENNFIPWKKEILGES